ncbi:potassium channel protein [Paramecium bursaria Chlorella virus AL2A]|uniref:Potassium channel protein n=2 Tax=unclassified Chlorovirus TaxID=346674 RepID=Q7T6V2_9PHYC|nr:potassium channel protein [Paramecium bursaria Chlorella virus AL2A]AAQ16133.1 potassium channel protein [Paramecium bursaria Chlorella virus MA1E]AAQ16137.1 potassium channel protein [Paramecium bursaria Chlorella virus XZ4C]AGE51472.1 potassium channel protein kcv [Paramecium bursaria Chlorella virus CviKI]AGE52489.1 potassium channel protein kcv [Paramecium bursaria Chlorella virus CvsA1]
MLVFSKFLTRTEPFMIHLLILAMFVMIYKFFPGGFENNFSVANPDKKASWIDCLYFGVTTHSTVGFGDILPKTTGAKLCTIAHICVVFFVVLTL